LRHPVSYAAMPGDEATNFGEAAPCAAGFRSGKAAQPGAARKDDHSGDLALEH